MRLENIYQSALILGGLLAAIIFGVFFYRELFPEYKIYQNSYVALEEFRSTYTGEPPPVFEEGVKQIVIPREDKGPARVDRCISCHVALQFSHFSATRIAKDINGKPLLDKQGIPVKVPNEDYIWAKLDQKIQDLTAENKLKEAEQLKALKVAHVGEFEYDMTKVLSMHPLIGKETRPFEFHPMDEYGCVSCHSGNGESLVTDRAHGPVFDGLYEEEYEGPKPEFLERDPLNDPSFSKVFNHKPGPRLLFQTTPILPGALIEAKCVQCHQPAKSNLEKLSADVNLAMRKSFNTIHLLQKSYQDDQAALLKLLLLRKNIEQNGLQAATTSLLKAIQGANYPADEEKALVENLKFAQSLKPETALQSIDTEILKLVGSEKDVKALTNSSESWTTSSLEAFIQAHPSSTGLLYAKKNTLAQLQDLLPSVKSLKLPTDSDVIGGLKSDIDQQTTHFQRGEELYIAQGCYACHRIAGFARGGVGPELTQEGLSYPWFVKLSMVWPQADLKTSTMPNYKLDHQELEDLMVFLMAQRGEKHYQSDVGSKIQLKAWEEWQKKPWEEPIPSSEIRNIRTGMTIFATEGCAACHRLKGYESNVGFAIEKGKPTPEALYEEREWFRRLIPEEALGSEIVKALDEQGKEFDQRVVIGVRSGSLLEEIETKFPDLIESFYSDFKYALRAKDHTGDAEAWKERVHRALMVYIQEYGLGRLIGPRPNWTGIYRSDQWLMEHFWNPQGHVPRSIMPVFPFDNTKFLALTYMLDQLAIKNTDQLRKIWDMRGFNPEMAYETLCSQCHGTHRKGNGPVAEWIYPIPKNLSNAAFLRGLTKERTIASITHGVLGGPMPPFGEASADKKHSPVLNTEEIRLLTDWLFNHLPGERLMEKGQDVQKWKYEPEDVIQELKKSGDSLSFSGTHTHQYLVALSPQIAPQDPLSVEAIFDKIPNVPSSSDPYSYYIKQKYYTPKNLQEGEEFFRVNCAVCHGNDADGSGLRSVAMDDAKPRMLINLDWLESRDDLRLLRSIKFGVPGTSMTPWGDLTTSLQRMQLVMYIRHLSEKREEFLKLKNQLYQVFQNEIWAVEFERSSTDEKIQKLDQEIQKNRLELRRQENVLAQGGSEADPTKIYNEWVNLNKDRLKLEEKNRLLQDLIEQIKKEKELYEKLGDRIFTLFGDSEEFAIYLKIIGLNRQFIDTKDGQLVLTPVDSDEMRLLQKKVIEAVESTKVKEEARREIKRQLIELDDLRKMQIKTYNQYKGIQNS